MVTSGLTGETTGERSVSNETHCIRRIGGRGRRVLLRDDLGSCRNRVRLGGSLFLPLPHRGTDHADLGLRAAFAPRLNATVGGRARRPVGKGNRTKYRSACALGRSRPAWSGVGLLACLGNEQLLANRTKHVDPKRLRFPRLGMRSRNRRWGLSRLQRAKHDMVDFRPGSNHLGCRHLQRHRITRGTAQRWQHRRENALGNRLASHRPVCGRSRRMPCDAQRMDSRRSPRGFIRVRVRRENENLP